MKRKQVADASSNNGSSRPTKKPHLHSQPPTTDIHSCFRSDLFKPQTLTSFQAAYQDSQPYRHGVIPTLISDSLLRSVRTEILTHISFTPKETDIYKIQQSGDLANLDGLEPAQLAHLPNLAKLRDALYSSDFRRFLEDVTGAGKLSGKKTDMAINIYTPGSYLLCHDDVIGSRRVSYILYLTDPDEPWQPEWGGGLRLYPTETKTNSHGEKVKVPAPEHVKVIPPSWGQLSFFAVQPGESFHDVEEVYPPPTGHEEDGNQRVRMAISGWYHIPQEGEDGFEQGAEEKLAERSSLSQLQGRKADEFDEPKPQLRRFDGGGLIQMSHDKSTSKGKAPVSAAPEEEQDIDVLTEADLDHLIQYISPSYLTPEMTGQLATSFEDNSFLQLDRFLCEKYARPLRKFVLRQDNLDSSEKSGRNELAGWETAKPPHKHRFLFQQTPSLESPSRVRMTASSEDTPIASLMMHLFPSTPFRKWLSIITSLQIDGTAFFDLLARRFRRGKDYALASSYEGENPRLEFTLGCTASGGWRSDQVDDEDGDGDGDEQNDTGAPKRENSDAKDTAVIEGQREMHDLEVGGEEVYMAGDDDGLDQAGDGMPTGDAPAGASTGRGKRSDPAIYQSASTEDEDAVLFSDEPAWNRFSIVLRDRGTLRFVKYVGRSAQGDRWDVKGIVELGDRAWDVGEQDEQQEVEAAELDEVEEEEEFEGFDNDEASESS